MQTISLSIAKRSFLKGRSRNPSPKCDVVLASKDEFEFPHSISTELKRMCSFGNRSNKLSVPDDFPSTSITQL